MIPIVMKKTLSSVGVKLLLALRLLSLADGQVCSVSASPQQLIGCVSAVMTAQVHTVLHQYDPLVVPNQMEPAPRWEGELTDIRLLGLSLFQPPAIAVTMPADNRIQFSITVQWPRLTASMLARVVSTRGPLRTPFFRARPELVFRQPYAQLGMIARLETLGAVVSPYIDEVNINLQTGDMRMNVRPQGAWGFVNAIMLYPAGRHMTSILNSVWISSKRKIEESIEELIKSVATNALKTAFP